MYITKHPAKPEIPLRESIQLNVYLLSVYSHRYIAFYQGIQYS